MGLHELVTCWSRVTKRSTEDWATIDFRTKVQGRGPSNTSQYIVPVELPRISQLGRLLSRS